jgi:hypothetical protein
MNLQHLGSLTDEIGLFEHCLGGDPRIEHGYCVDDVARALIVIMREPGMSPERQRLLEIYLAFLADSQSSDGRIVNRRDACGQWHGAPSTADHWGRALWAWGTVVRASGDTGIAAEAYEHFRISARRRSVFLRSMVFAALGASQVLDVLPGNRAAMGIVRDTIAMFPAAGSGRWVWPEAMLTYANAAIPEVMMLSGFHVNDQHLVRQGRHALEWLWQLQYTGGRLSVIPHRGWVPGDALPAFDQQPIEVAALIDACVTAYDLTSDPLWLDRIDVGRRWFDGRNDQGIAMFDPTTGAGYDALTLDGRNDNRGAESTIAYLSVDQRARSLLAKAA